MTATAQRMRLRLFIEGVEVPVIAAQVQTAPNSPAACSIQIPPLAEGTRLLPRSLVHLYFLDFYQVESPLLHNKPRVLDMNQTKDPTLYERSLKQAESNMPGSSGRDTDDYSNERYKLLFGGEVVGFQWTKNERQRSLVLQCIDWSNYWDYAYQWNNTDIFGPGIKALFSGGSTNLFTDFLTNEGSIIAKMVRTKSINYPALKGLLGGIVHLLEAIGGSYYREKQIGGVNIFFTVAELRLHLTQMITAFDLDDTAARLLDAQGWDGLFGRIMGNLGSQVSIRQAMNALMSVIFHETYPIPTPLFTPGTEGTVSGYVRKNLLDDPRTMGIAAAADNVMDAIHSVLAALVGSEDSIRFALHSAIIQLKTARKLLTDKAKDIRTSPCPRVGSFFSAASTDLGNAITGLSSKKVLSAASLAKTKHYLTDALTQLERARNLTYNATPKKVAVPARLNQQIFRPDIWFSSPPRCNVLFPDNYTTLSYARAFLQEPTRLMLKTNDAFFGEDELFDHFYFAPKSFTLKGEKTSLQSILKNDILDHELYTGILPVFEKMSELNIFAVRSGKVDGNMPKVGLAQRSCNFLYFKYRFAARQMSVVCRFNPYVVPGFPGLVIDKYVDAEQLKRQNVLLAKTGRPTRDISRLLGTNFLGNFTELTHSVDQSQGSTNINCGYARQPEESVEFLGADTAQGQVTMRTKTGKLASRRSDVAALYPPRIGSLGPMMGEITSVQDITQATTGSPLPLYRGSRNKKGAPNIPIQVGVPNKASYFGKEAVEQAGDPNLIVTFKGFRVTETLPQYNKGKVALSAEELIRPGWYSNMWRPDNIGQAYEQFFKIGSINDPIQITDTSGASLGVQNADDQTVSADETDTDAAADPTGEQNRVYTQTKYADIEQAVNYLVTVYSQIKHSNVDVDEFIRAFTWRPIASMVDMFGTSDLDMQPQSDGSVIAKTGILGMHSLAFGQYNDLFGLVTGDIENVAGIKRGSSAAMRVDTRKRKQDAVLDYVNALSFARAILG